MRFQASVLFDSIPFLHVLLILALLDCRSFCGMLRLPEFVEPIKNVTLTEGSDIEFSCDVRYLGTYRVTWIWHKEDEQKFLSIGVIKIISNPRVHITRLQKSDDVTQFSVNSNPMIAQIGTLEVITDSSIEKDLVEKPITEFPDSSTSYDMKDSEAESLSSTEIDTENANATSTSEPCAGDKEPCNNSDMLETGKEGNPNDRLNENSTELCIDINDLWETTRERVSDIFSTVIKFTYSYWFS